MLLFVAIPFVVVVAALGLYLAVFRDTWERDNRAKLLALKAEACSLVSSGKVKDGYYKYEELLQQVGDRNIKDAYLDGAMAAARKERDAAYVQVSAIVEQEKAAERARQQQEHKRQEEARLAEQRRREEEVLRKRQQDEAERQAKAREATYGEYLRKSEEFFDSLLRTSSDLEVGISYKDFGDRLRDMNFKYNKCTDALNAEEKRYLSVRLMEVTLNQFIASQDNWKNRFGEKRGPYWYAEIMMQWRWKLATEALAWVKNCRKCKDALPSQQCTSCGGKGTLVCPWCAGTRQCPLCKGKMDKYHICCITGDCEACDRKGAFTCPICQGTGKLGS
jgi:hypothetical protein